VTSTWAFSATALSTSATMTALAWVTPLWLEGPVIASTRTNVSTSNTFLIQIFDELIDELFWQFNSSDFVKHFDASNRTVW
tara:strand:- start:13 stop:255 length:243 start_codon:yes stop_codon:yes gene_type:complete